VRHQRLGAAVNGGFEHHLVHGVTELRSPLELYIDRLARGCQDGEGPIDLDEAEPCHERRRHISMWEAQPACSPLRRVALVSASRLGALSGLRKDRLRSSPLRATGPRGKVTLSLDLRPDAGRQSDGDVLIEADAGCFGLRGRRFLEVLRDPPGESRSSLDPPEHGSGPFYRNAEASGAGGHVSNVETRDDIVSENDGAAHDIT